MMGYLNKVKSSMVALIYGICLCTGAAYAAGSPTVKIDGYDQLVAAWHDTDTGTGFLKIIGSYGTSSPTTAILTDPSAVHAFSPVLATSHSNSASTTAVAIWKAYDLFAGNQVIQVAVASTSGWTANSGTTVSDVLSEIPQNEYQVDISDDGSVIGITWSSYIISTGDVVVRKVYSTNGGFSWTSPVTL